MFLFEIVSDPKTGFPFCTLFSAQDDDSQSQINIYRNRFLKHIQYFAGNVYGFFFNENAFRYVPIIFYFYVIQEIRFYTDDSQNSLITVSRANGENQKEDGSDLNLVSLI